MDLTFFPPLYQLVEAFFARAGAGARRHGGVGKARFQQSATTHSGTGEKETLNMNVVGTKILHQSRRNKY